MRFQPLHSSASSATVHNSTTLELVQLTGPSGQRRAVRCLVGFSVVYGNAHLGIALRVFRLCATWLGHKQSVGTIHGTSFSDGGSLRQALLFLCKSKDKPATRAPLPCGCLLRCHRE